MLGGAPGGGMLNPHAGAGTEHPGVNVHSPNPDSGPASGWSTALPPKSDGLSKSPFGSWRVRSFSKAPLVHLVWSLPPVLLTSFRPPTLVSVLERNLLTSLSPGF